MFLILAVSATAWGEEATISTFTNTSGKFGDVSYNSYKGGGTSNPAVNSSAIRLYQNSNGNTGGYIVLSVPDGYTITSATIKSTMATTTGYYIESNPGNNTPAKANFEVSNRSLSANTEYTVSGLSTQYITFACFGTSSSSRLYVSYLSVTYQSAAAQTYNVTLSRNGVTEIINDVEEGTPLDNIDGTGDQRGCSPEWVFEGWSKTQRTDQNNTAVMDLVTTVDGAGPYYAVYSHTEGSGGSTTATMSSFSAVSGNVNNDANVSYTAAKGSAGTAPAINDSQIRIYQNGGTLTITGNNDKTLTSITIGSAMNTSVSYKIDGGTESSNQSIAANGKFTLNNIEASSVLFTCKGTDKNSRLYLNHLSVTYSGGNTVYYTTSPDCTTQTSVTLNPNGGTGGTTSVTATYGQSMPTITPATLAGYALTGYFDAVSRGTKYYNADGTSAKNWDKEDATFTLYAQWECVTPTISTQPQSATYNQGTEATPLSVTATAEGANMSYKWQKSTNNSNWNDISGETTNTYKPSTSDAGTTYYRVIVTNAAADCQTQATSNVATIVVNACYDAVNVVKGTASNGSFTMVSGYCSTCNGHVSVTLNDIQPDAGYQFSTITQSGVDDAKVTIDNDAKTVTYAQNTTGTSTINVIFTPAVYTINYKDQGGANFSGTHEEGYPTTHTYNATTNLKSASKEHYTFGGWYKESDCSGTPVTTLGATEYTDNITLYAQWTAKTYTITLDANGGTFVDKRDSQTKGSATFDYIYGTYATYSDAPNLTEYYTDLKCDGYQFDKWVSGGSPWNKLFTGTGDRTIKAQWSKLYSITLSENGTTTELTPQTSTSYTLPTELSAGTCQDDTKALVGWSTVAIPTPGDKPASNFYELGAKVTLTADQTTFYAVFATAEGVASTDYTKITDINNLTDGNYVIAYGYNTTTPSIILKATTKDETTLVATSASPSSNKYQNPAAENIWTIKKSGTTYTLYNETTSKYVQANTTPALLLADANPTNFNIEYSTDHWKIKINGNTSYQLVGYTNASGNYFQTKSGVSASYKIQLYKNTSTVSYSDYTTTCDATKATITYDLNGGTEATCEQQTVTKGDEFNLCSSTPTKNGYTFAGWSDGTKTYTAGAEVTISESTTFYASWKANTITITWDLNYTDCPEAETSTYVYNGDEIEMPEDPIRTGYKFNGWYTKANDGTEVTEVGDENKPSADVTYYAQWEKLHTVTFIASGQVYVKQEHKYISGDKLVLPEIDPSAANFACDGYLFEGWSKYQQTKEDANCPELVDANTLVENDLELHAVWKKASTSGAGTQIFYESFDTENGTGGNDDKWSGDIAKNSKVNTTWTFENEGGAYQCIKLGSASKKGSATTPALTQLSGDATLSFKAAAWNGNSESTTLKLTISGGGTLTLTSVTLVKGAWTTYEVQITDGTPSSTITFAAANTSNNRFFLDEVKITTSGSYNYTTVPNCGPTMVAKENVWVTSANGQSVKVNVPLGIKLFEGNATITGTSTNENFVVNTLENAGNGEHQVVVVYTPTADDTKENTTITLTAKNGEDTWATTTFVLNGRSLPNEFVVVANRGDKNYALPANMTEAGTYAGLVVEVSGEEVIAAPKSYLYNIRAVHSTHFAENGTALRLVGNNDACLWASNAVSGTSIRNWAKLINANTANYEWNLYTEDGETYYLSSSAVTEEGRVLRLYGNNFGMYKEGVNTFRFFPVGCTSTPMNVQTSTTRTSATISWTNASECNVVVTQGSTTVQSISAAASPLVVGNLAESTTYTFTLTPTDDASCGTEGSFTTTGPTIDIVEWQTGGIRIYVDKDENVNPKVIINGEEEHGNVGGQVATELFFSKYYEAHAENKLLAVYNGTTQTIDLNGYVIKHGIVEIDLSQYGQTKGFIAPNEEIIFVSFDTDDNKSAESCAKKEEGFRSWNVLGTSDLAFSGRGSVGLYKNDVLIDLIGSIYPSGELTKIGKAGKPDYCGTEDDVQLHVDGVSVNDQSSFFCHNGDNIKTPEVETNYPISTNRCLLIRKNTVTSGATAVTSNKAEAGATCGDLSSTFTTLCTEWSGFRIGSGSSSTAEIQDATCEGLGYVGGFDYNNYYRTMETIHTGETLDKYDKNDKDNTYFIEFEVPIYSCLNIQLQLTDNDGNVLADQISQVPILVGGKKTTTDEIFSAIVKNGETPDYENSKIRCATCDVVILESATLTKAAPGTKNDVNQVRDIYVYPGGKLIVPEEADDYSVNSLSLRRDQDEVGTATIISQLNITSSLDKPIYADVRINSENWHWFTLPYDCNIADVTWKNGSKAIYNSDWFLMTYNGEQRAATQSGGCWVSYEGTTIEAGKGYIIGITGHPTKSGVQYELRFPMAKEVLTKESDPAGKQVAVNAWGVKENIRPNHKGWNLVGNPYLDSYQPTTSGFKGLSLLKYTEVDPVTGEWYYDNSGTIPYLVTPINGGWYAYEQELASETQMKPLTAYFVQVGDPNNDDHENGEELYANFTPSSRANLQKSIVRRAPSEVNETEEPVIVGVALTNSLGESDKTSLVIDDRFTNEYEMNADFFKWFGDYYNYYTKPVLYTIGADQGKRAFNALNEELAKQPIPMGMYAAQAGNYTFSLNQQFDLSRVEEVWLYDATQSTYTNLMQSDYTFSTSKVNGAGRFSLSVKLAPKVATGMDNVTADKVWATTHTKQVIVNGLENGMHLWLYDATGKLLYNEPTSNYQHTYLVPQTGTYFVSVMNGNQKQTIKVVVE